MTFQSQNNLSNFFIAGINYKKTDAAIRGQFAVNNDQYAAICNAAPLAGVSEFFILSTCNRTEIYGFAENIYRLTDLLCSATAGGKDTFLRLCYMKQGAEAVQHIFEVGAGLESQILGDYEIIGQIKLSLKIAKQYGCTGAFLERLVNIVLQSTKTIKNQTVLSGGTVSVAFAAVQCIKKTFTSIAGKRILLLGVGKIGRNTCKNLVDYLNTKNITLINRTGEKAAELSAELCVNHASYNELPSYIQSSDIILVATNSDTPVILASQLAGDSDKLVIDLSIPHNVEKKAKELPNITLIDVDELSRLKDETLQKRIAEVPKAKAIIAEQKEEFLEWNNMRKNAPVIKAVKQKLRDMHQCRLFLSNNANTADNSVRSVNQHHIKKVIKNMAVKMRVQHQPGCSYIEAINDFITTHVN